MNCIWEESPREDGRFHCQRENCVGRCTKQTTKRNCDEFRVAGEAIDEPTQLGDAVEDFLSSYGITKEWWGEFLEKHGLPPCQCDDNQIWLNEVSSAHPTIESFGVKLLAALTRKT